MVDLQKTFFIEKALLKALSIREHYEKYNEYVTYDRLFAETKLLLTDYARYYDLYPDHTAIDFETFATQFTSNWHNTMDSYTLDVYQQAIVNISSSDIDSAETALLGLVNKQLIDDVIKLGERPFTPEHLTSIVERYEDNRAGVLQEFDKDCFELEDIDLAEANPEDGIPYAFKAVQDALYGQVKGDLIVLNAAYGIGKSACLFTQIVHTFKWLHEVGDDRPILFFNSEGSAGQAFGRLLSNLYKEKCPEGYMYIVKNQEKIKAHFFSRYKKLFKIYRSNGRGFQFIKDKVKKYNPAVVYIDMAKGAISAPRGNETETSSLEAFFQKLRDLSSTSCPIWTTVQAGESAFFYDKDSQTKKHKSWVDSNDIYGSKTGIQGSASVILSMGMNDARPLTRYIQATKTKGENTPPKFICEIEKKFSNYRELDFIENEDKE